MSSDTKIWALEQQYLRKNPYTSILVESMKRK